MTTSHSRRTTEDEFIRVAPGVFASAAAVAGASATLVTNALGHVARLVGDVAGDSKGVAREARDLWEITRRRAGEVGDAVRATPRFTRVATEILRLVAEIRLHQALAPARAGILGDAADAAALERLHERGARRLHRLCVELRGGVLKVGQFVSSRMDLLPEAYVRELARLQDRVPPVPGDAIVERVAGELGAAPGALFASFDDTPIAAASLAQVHAARLADGTPVAVKVQVPGIEEIVEIDLAALRFVVPVLEDALPFADLGTVAAELTRSVRAELDYRDEARHARAFAACFAADRDVIVPAVHADFSTRRVLTLEHVEGERLTDWLDACERRGEEGDRDRDRLFEILLGCFCSQVLEHGLLHADPHPGNFLVVAGDDGPRLALLDFGSVQVYAPARRRAYAELALAVFAGNPQKLAESFAAMGFRSRDGESEGLRAFADLLLQAFREDATLDARSLDPRDALDRILRLTRENPIVAIPGDFVQLGRVFAGLGGLIVRYRPRVNLFRILMPRLLAATRASG